MGEGRNKGEGNEKERKNGKWKEMRNGKCLKKSLKKVILQRKSCGS
jgi:hypothetical protein